MKTEWMKALPFLFLVACAGSVGEPIEEPVDPKDECVFCDSKADAFGISRESYLAAGIVKLANEATFEELDDDVPLDVRAARGIVAQRPFEFIEQIDTVSYVGRVAFANLARYAQDNGYVPYCGDGELQNLLEACDDGNENDGDGCSSTCAVEQGTGASYLAEQSGVIIGADINVPLVHANTYYLRQRSWSGLGLGDELIALLERADGINANSEADDKISFDELVILSKEPFYSSLFTDEKDALEDAWKLLEVSSAPISVVQYQGPNISREVPFTSKVERVGPIVVDPVRRISSLDSETLRDVCRRLQQMQGTNADGDDETVELADVEKALADYEPVFTSSEMWQLEQLHELYFEEATPEFGGDFSIEFDQLPDGDRQRYVVGDFDGYEFRITVKQEVQWDGADPDSGWLSWDANLRTETSIKPILTHNGEWEGTTCGYWTICPPFEHRGIHFLRLDGTEVNGGTRHGIFLMEHFKDGERIYNRLVEFKTTFADIDRVRTYHNEYAAARPSLTDGTPLSLRKKDVVSYNDRNYTRFKPAEVQTIFNTNVKKFFPDSWGKLERQLQPGRYEEFEGVVLEIHESRAAIAYWGTCEMPFAFDKGDMETENCGGKRVEIDFLNDATLRVYDGGRLQGEALLYKNSFHSGTPLDLDRSYYIVK